MHRTLFLSSLFLVAACDGKSDGTGPTTGTTVTDPCLGKTVTPLPAVDATGVYYRSAVEFSMSEVESDATLTLDGVTGTQSIVENRVIFTPDAPLAPSTTYTMTLDWSCGPTASSFTTSDIGAPATPGDLVGKTWSVDIGSGRFVEPAGIGGVVGGLLEVPLYIGVTAADATTVTFASVPSSSTDICGDLSAFPTPGDFSQNPYFSVTTPASNLDIQDVTVTLQDTTFTGAFAANGSSIAGLTLEGTLDVGPLEVVVGSDPCTALAGIGATCIPCPDGVSQSCLEVLVDSITATEVAGTSLVCP